MSGFLRSFARKADFVSQTDAPLDTNGAKFQSSPFEDKVNDILEHLKNPPVGIDALPALIDAFKNKSGVGLDDRELLLEVILTAMSRLQGHPLSQKLQEYVISLLYKDLPHPPAGYLTLPKDEPCCCLTTKNHTTCEEKAKKALPQAKYAFRSADGSNYNPLFPSMGQAKRPYARSVPSKHTLPKDSLPDAGLVFDTLLLRDKFEEHPGGISSLFFAFADLVIHSIFDTDHHDWTINNASSYLDLSVLYGGDETKINAVRRKDGTGRLWNDVFGDYRLLHMPPASCALLVLMNRNHNYIAQKILDINESGKFKKTFANDTEREIQDNEIFERARLVNCGYFMHIILGDYVGAILGLARDGSSWRLDPLMPIRNSSHSLEPVGEGNVCSVEFNMLYRWHATLSEKDTEWTTDTFNTFFQGKDPKTVVVDDFIAGAHKFLKPAGGPREWTFGKLSRDANGKFSDDDLANILQRATEWRAGAFKARGTPAAMRIIEVMGIEQARSWGTCSMNEFRKFVGLKPYASFDEWNPNPEISKAAQSLYRDIDNLELYVGLQAEEAKKPGPGAGLCPGYTISRAILADAVCLTRGDRFFTTDFTPGNLTSWGFQDCQYDPQDGSYGGLLTKLLFRTLPNHYPRGSAYAHFPFMTPNFMKSNLQEYHPELVEKYNWNPPTKAGTPVTPVKTFAGVKQVLTPGFISTADNRIYTIAKPVITKKLSRRDSVKRLSTLKGLSSDLTKSSREVFELAFSKPADVSAFFAKKTQELIDTHSYSSADKSFKFVDVINDVVNLLPIHWISQELAGLPLKTAANPKGAWREQEVYEWFSDIAEYVHLNLSAENDWRLRESSQKHCIGIVEFIEGHIDSLASFSLSDSFNHRGTGSHNGHSFLKQVWDKIGPKHSSHSEVAAHVFSALIPTAAIYSATLAHTLNFFLQDAQKDARTQLLELVKSKEEDAPAKVSGYIREALRLSPPVPGVYRQAGQAGLVAGDAVQVGETIFASITSANLDSAVFGPDPAVPDYTRSGDKGGVLGFADDGLASEKFLLATVPAVLNVILSQEGLRRGPGRSGRIAAFKESYLGTPRELYINSRGAIAQFPDSLVIQYDHAPAPKA
ncbi:heme peroxidase [Ephemerocybe angulata]|uniref:Heme peroxidase n=1 Tax=Ephemerocybe angulata TaxID=980116 RepID=A0A8H6I7K0_9AGAR|nr:heme peroxidase [Tulosesus angulatus]